MVEAISHSSPDRTRPVPPVLQRGEIDLFDIKNGTSFFVSHEDIRIPAEALPLGFKQHNLGLEYLDEETGETKRISIIWDPTKARVSWYNHTTEADRLEFEAGVRETGVNVILPTGVPRRTVLYRKDAGNHTRY